MPSVQDHHEQDDRSGHNISSKSCQRCEHCDAHYYWYHLDDTQKYFFKFMVGDFQEKMTIPEKFVKNFRSQISEVVKLEGPDGSIFDIQVTKDPNKIVFLSGWGAFASFYELKQGYLLVFRYSGGSHFKVLIFDYPSCCERTVFHVVMNCGANAHERDICPDQSPTRERRCQDGRSSNSKSCQRCEQCDTHYYWHHLDDTKKHFFKLMVGDFRQEMTISEKFVNNFRSQISELIKLEAPDGSIYDIQVTRDPNKIVLGSGWAAFANACEIEEHDLLVFRYSGDSHFKALIFDPSGCEKEVFHAVMNHAPHVQERDICRDQLLPRETIQLDGGSRDSDSERTSHTPLDSPSPGSRDSDSERTAKTTPLYSPSPGSAESAASLEEIQNPMGLGGVQATTEPLYVLDTGCSLTTADKGRVDTLAETNRLGIPLYVRALDKTSLSGSLFICKDYAAKYLPREDQPITLCHPQHSKTWGANLKVITDGACLLSCILSAGWPGFVRDNKLREGDICVFQVSKSNSRVTMIVHPFQGSCQPPVEEPEPPSICKRCPVKGEPTVKDESDEEEHGEPEYYYSRFASYLTADEQEEIFGLASIQPGNPVYVAVLRESHVGDRSNLLVIPKKLAAKHLAERSHSILLLRPNRKQKWYVRYYYNAKVTRGFSCRRWSRFVKENRLREGYICVFELMKGAKMTTTTMTVHVIRKVDDRFVLLD